MSPLPSMFQVNVLGKCYLADLLCVNHGQRSSEDGEVLAEDVRRPAVDQTVAGDHGIARNFVLKSNKTF